MRAIIAVAALAITAATRNLAAQSVDLNLPASSVSLLRVTGARTTSRSALAADVLLEHPHSSGRDALDLITTIAASRALTSSLWLGIEAMGSELEGFWQRHEAEGGATLLVSPTLAVAAFPHWIWSSEAGRWSARRPAW